jgi:hypothetical protein
MAYFKKVDKRATLKEARIRELTVAALAMLEEGWSEEKVEEELRRTAIYLWAPSYNTLKVYIQAAMARAQAQLEEARRQEQEGKRVNKSGA